MWTYPPRPEQYQPYSSQIRQGHLSTNNPAGQTMPFAQNTGPLYPVQSRPRRSGLRTGAIIALIIVVLAVFGTGLFAGWEFGRVGTTSSTGSSPFQSGNSSTVTIPQLTSNNQDAVREAIVSKVQAAVVQIDVTTATQEALGSGVIIDGRGYIITNDHVVSGASTIQVVLSNHVTLAARLVGTDTADDLAMVKITPPSSGLTVLSFADSSQIKVGEGVLAIGSPLGNADTVTSGIVSALNRNISESTSGPTLPDAIQTDAPINPGNSGGALVDMQGNLVGLPTLTAVNTETNTPANGLGFAIPSNRVKFIAQQLIASGQVAHTGRALLGVKVTSVTSDIATQQHLSVQSGALIASVTSGSAASAAGLQANDVIVQIGSNTIQDTSELSAALLTHNPGETVAVKIYRGTQQMTVNVTLGELPAN